MVGRTRAQSLSEPAFFDGVMRCLAQEDLDLAEKALYALEALLTVPRNVWVFKVHPRSPGAPNNPGAGASSACYHLPMWSCVCARVWATVERSLAFLFTLLTGGTIVSWMT